jgi:hypothetical protein
MHSSEEKARIAVGRVLSVKENDAADGPETAQEVS